MPLSTDTAKVRSAGYQSSAANEPALRHAALAEVWGDVVDLGDLARAILIGAVVSLAFYLVGARMFTLVATPDVARSYAMLAGLIGCIAGGAVCARLFHPKRVVSENAMALGENHDDFDTDFGREDAALPPRVRAEMRDLGLSASGLSASSAPPPYA